MANEKYGASGSFTGRLEKLEVKKSGKGKEYANVEVKVGEATVKLNAFKAEVIKALSGFVIGEQIHFWLTLESKPNKDNTAVYTNATLGKMYDEKSLPASGTQGKAYVKGLVTATGDIFSKKDATKKVGRFVDMDATQNEKYPTTVRVQLAYGTDTDNIAVGDELTLEVTPDKYGAWVFEGEKKTGNGKGSSIVGKHFPTSKATPSEAPAPAAEPEAASPYSNVVF